MALTIQRARAPSWVDQDEQLRDMWQNGEPPEKIADALSRTVAAVMTRAARLGLPRRFAPGRKPRTDRPGNGVPVGTPVRPAQRPVQVKPQPKDPKGTIRSCLMCTSKFYSAGPHNRICPKCKESPDFDAGSRLPDLGYFY